MAVKPKSTGGKSVGNADEDAALWRRVTESVKPLKPGKSSNRFVEKPVTTSVNTESSSKKKDKAPVYAHHGRPLPSQGTTSSRSHDLNHGNAPGVDKRTHQRMIKGKMPIEGRLDLHGHTKESAHRALDAFIKGAYSAGRRCVIVITGKGLRIESGEVGVLRQSVPQWLNGPVLRPMVLAFSHATPKDGGEGALYVLLKRKR